MVGIVILNYNSWADTVACVDSIHEAEKKLEFRIYLVDNCSPVRPEPGVLESLDKRGVILSRMNGMQVIRLEITLG